MNEERIEVSLGKSGGTKVFETFQELETWLSSQQAFWTWLANPPHADGKAAAWQRYSSFFANLRNHLDEAKRLKAHGQPQNVQSHINNIKSFFNQNFNQQSCYVSTSPLAKFIEQLRKDENDAVAGAALAYSLRCPISQNHFETFRGALIGFAFETGARDRKPLELQSLDDLRVEWESKFQTFRDTLQTETETHKKLNADGGQLISKQDAALKELIAKQESDLNELIAKSRADWRELHKTYDDMLALRSPVTYWTKKAKGHFWMSLAYAVVTIAAGILAMIFFIPEVKSMMQPPQGIHDVDKWHPEYWRLAVLVASGLFGVWVIRILVRLLLSNIHLLTDARERVTMVQTYLALLRRGKLKDDERMFILQTLFRPTPTGIVKDDAVPLTIVEGITKIGK